jgi:hypothetical protein
MRLYAKWAAIQDNCHAVGNRDICDLPSNESRLARIDDRVKGCSRSHRHNVTTAGFGFVEALICDLEQFVRWWSVLRKRSYASRERKWAKGLLLVLQPQVRYLGAQRVRADSRALGWWLRQDNGELLATIAAAYIGGAKESAKEVRKRLEHHIARIMTEGIIEPLEVVEVEEKNG